METNVNLRQLALDILLLAEQRNKSFHDMLHVTLRRYQHLPKTERAFLTRLTEGTVEYQIYLDYVIDTFSKTKVKQCKPCIRVILRMAVYQICFMSNVPKEAACNEAVKLAKKKGFHNLAGFVNGVLRSVCRELDTVTLPSETDAPEAYLSVKYSTPEWLIRYLLRYYPYSVLSDFLQAGFCEQKTSLRVNTSKTTVAALKEKMEAQGISVSSGFYVDNALLIQNYNYIRRVPGFADGLFAVQDESSMLVAKVLAPKQGSLVLDMCAAPGGKCFAVADCLLDGQIIARDVSDDKLEKLSENQERMGFANVRPEKWNGLVLDEKLVGTADYVICDAPCSGIGVIGKKKDIKYRLSEESLSELVDLQRKLLTNAWQYLKPDGVLLYSTCTINPAENEENVAWLTGNFPLKTESIDEYLPEALCCETTRNGMLTLLPGRHHCDGFFLSRLKRV